MQEQKDPDQKKQRKSKRIYGIFFILLLVVAFYLVLITYYSNTDYHDQEEDEVINNAVRFEAGPEPPQNPMEPVQYNNKLTEESLPKYNVNSLEQYRHFLANANMMLVKMHQNLEFTDELLIFSKMSHPDEIQSIIGSLIEINEIILAAQDNPELDLPIQSEFLAKRIKIKNRANELLIETKVRELAEQLKTLQNYIFGKELQGKFFE